MSLTDMKEQRNGVSVKMEALTDSITKLDLKVLDMESNNEVAAEIGPLRYMAEITNKPMATIVNWFTLLIVCVFDPLAIAMVLAVNKFIGRKEEDEVDYYTARNKMLHKHSIMNGEKLKKKKEKLNQEEMIKKNEEIVAVTPTNTDELKMNKKEFLESLDKVERNLKEDDKKIYGGYSKPYSDGTYINETDLESDDDDIKTY